MDPQRFKVNPNLLQRRLLLLYDCDANKPSETKHNKLFIRTIPRDDSNTTFRKGIENLLPAELAQDSFYSEQPDDYGGFRRQLQKRRLCDWVCQQRAPAHFAQFSVILKIIDDFLGSQSEGNE